MLSPLQEQVAAIIAGLEEAEGFALAGGAALIARGDVRRSTRDLDFFGLTPDAVDRLIPIVESALETAGLSVRRIQEGAGFARLLVDDGREQTELDLAADARLFPAEPGEHAPLLAGEELAVDKLLALFGRAEARDFVDLMALEPRYGLVRLCQLAAEKDRGFDPGCSQTCWVGSAVSGATSSSSTTPDSSGSPKRSGGGGSAPSSLQVSVSSTRAAAGIWASSAELRRVQTCQYVPFACRTCPHRCPHGDEKNVHLQGCSSPGGPKLQCRQP